MEIGAPVSHTRCNSYTFLLPRFVFCSGGGKSTTVSLIERFYDPLSGAVKLDGMDIRDLNLKHLRGLIGYVGQEPTLFATSIAGNIRYGNPDATQEEVEAAAKLANAHDFVSAFPDGYDTQVGDKGAQLSGGECARNTCFFRRRVIPGDAIKFHSPFGRYLTSALSVCFLTELLALPYD